MKICASLGASDEVEETYVADLTELRLDITGNVPGVKKPVLVTPNGVDFNSECDYLDVGSSSPCDRNYTTISSHHDFEKTPSVSECLSILDNMQGNIKKGAFKTNSFEDLNNIFKISQSLKEKHILIGMGEFGKITRIRSELLGNEFTFGHTGTPTAEGQLSVRELRDLGDDCVITGLVGNPIKHSLSPIIQDAAFKDAEINGKYLLFNAESLDDLKEVMIEYNIRGLNITAPYKRKITEYFGKGSDINNTVLNDNGKFLLYNTDLKGIEHAFNKANASLDQKNVLILGTGNTAENFATILRKHKSEFSVCGRSPESVKKFCKEYGCEESQFSKKFDIIANCTPIGMYSSSPYPTDISCLNENQTVFDVSYGLETELCKAASSKGAKFVCGIDMLIGQGAESFRIWTGYDISEKVMEDSL